MATSRADSTASDLRKQMLLALEEELARRNALRVVQEHYTGKSGVLQGNCSSCVAIGACRERRRFLQITWFNTSQQVTRLFFTHACHTWCMSCLCAIAVPAY
jgi:hypothetical protein